MVENILILDFGSQVTQLIARCVRENGVYSEIVPYYNAESAIEKLEPKAVILSGGPSSVTEREAPRLAPVIFKTGLPLLGICYGQQVLCDQLGGDVEVSDQREFGRAVININKRCELFEGIWEIGDRAQVWMSHGDRVNVIPSGFDVMATNDATPFAIIADEARKIYGVQFHPEVMHTPDGKALLRNFTHKIARCAGDWSMSGFKEKSIQRVRDQIGDGRVICGLSGGIDSSVVAVLLHEAIGDQLTCVFVDHGLLRKGEGKEVVGLFREHFNIPLVDREVGDYFIGRLEKITDPEEKRKIIGRAFIEIFEQEAVKLGGADFLAQGTLYPDVIESVSALGGPSVTIKSHHNVGGLPEKMNMKLVDPLRELFKDEVRELGINLGLPKTVVKRHPFPGPGLAIRIPGEVTRDKLEILRDADSIYIEELKNANLYDDIWQAFSVLLPVRTVGVMGDSRTYEYVCALRAVTSIDGMTADYFPFNSNFIGQVASRIINEVKGINRVVYDITSKPPGTIEWE